MERRIGLFLESLKNTLLGAVHRKESVEKAIIDAIGKKVPMTITLKGSHIHIRTHPIVRLEVIRKKEEILGVLKGENINFTDIRF